MVIYTVSLLKEAKYSAPTRRTAYSAVVTMAVVLTVRFGTPGAFRKSRDLAQNIGRTYPYIAKHIKAVGN